MLSRRYVAATSRSPLISKTTSVSIVALFAAGAFAPHTAQAQSSGASGVEQIVVRATRRETSLQETPVAVTALNEEQVRFLAPQDLGDMAALVPNFSASKITGFNAASFAIRGAGQTDIIVYSESQVAVTLDDFVVPHVQTQLLDLFDIEQIEVLRGPQGTLFGKNAVAGVVNVRTKRPDLEDFSGDLGVTYGSFNRFNAQAAINIPLSDQFAFRFAGQFQSSDGYYRNGAAYGPLTPFGQIDEEGTNINPSLGATGQGDGRRLGGEEVINFRAKLLWEPSDNFNALLQYELVRENSDAVPAINETPVGDPRFVFNNLGYTQDPGDPLDNAGITDADAIGAFDIGLLDDGHQVDVDGFYLNMELELGGATITSITGFRKQTSALANNYLGEVGPISQFDANRADERETFQQEIRVNYDINDKWDVVAGVFYQSNDTTFCVTQVLGFLDLFGLAPAGTFNNTPQVLCNAQDSDAYAGFADTTYRITDRLTFSGGLRYTWEDKDWIGRNQRNFQQLNDGAFDTSLTFDTVGLLGAADFERFPDGVLTSEYSEGEISWRGVLSYEFSDDLYGYASVSRSFRSGAFNDQSGTTGNELTAAGIAATDPEIATSYEIGFRSEWADGQFRFNPTFFYVNYKDAQRQIAATLTNSAGVEFQETRFFNAADARVFGIELETLWVPAGTDWTFGANGSWQDAKFKTFQADTDFDGTIDVDFSDRPLTRTPEFTFTMFGRYEREITNDLRIRLGATVAYEDDNVYSYSDIDSAFDTTLNARTLITLTAELADIDDRWSVRAFVRNLTDERYRVSSQAVANLWVFSQYGEPRAFGVEANIGF